MPAPPRRATCRTSYPQLIAYATGHVSYTSTTPYPTGGAWATTYADHTAIGVPNQVNNGDQNRGDLALTEFPFL